MACGVGLVSWVVEVRLAELMAAMSLATDLGMGQELESGLGVCLVAVAFAGALGLDDDDVHRVFFLALTRHIGCTAGTHELAGAVGDDVELRRGMAAVDYMKPQEVLGFMLGHVNRTVAPLGRPAAIARILMAGRAMKEGSRAVCEVAEMLSPRFGFDDAFTFELAAIFEAVDGRGFPGRLKGDEIPTVSQVVQIADAATIFAGLGGAGAVRDTLRARAGRWCRPELAETFVAHAGGLLAVLDVPSRWSAAMDAEPHPRRTLRDSEVDEALRAMGDFADLKSPFTVGHSNGVAELAAAAGERAGLPDDDVTTLRRAGWVHDLGRVSVSAATWAREGPLTSAEWERVRLHPYHTDRALDRSPFLRSLSSIASMHHERVDGGGYFRSSPASAQTPSIRILEAADVFRAMTERRPHRPALEPADAERELRAEVRAGRLDADAVEAVASAAGRPVRRRREGVGGLTAREIEVLRLLARGRSNKEIARELTVAPKTVDAHVQHVYAKLGVSTRPAATMFAMRFGLVDAEPAEDRGSAR
jgi:HD-GYP domain-containing protein (c-di-GMP phosphodiesterase class II)